MANEKEEGLKGVEASNKPPKVKREKLTKDMPGGTRLSVEITVNGITFFRRDVVLFENESDKDNKIYKVDDSDKIEQSKGKDFKDLAKRLIDK